MPATIKAPAPAKAPAPTPTPAATPVHEDGAGFDIEAAILAGMDPEDEPTDEPPPEPENPEPAAEPLETPPDENPDAWLDELPADLRARVDALKTERDEAQAAAKKPEVKKDEPKAGPKKPAKVNPLAHVATLGDLDGAIERSEAIRDWCIENWEGGTVTVGEEDRNFTADEILRMYHREDEVLRKWAPQRERFLLESQALEKETAKAYPWLAKTDAPEYQDYRILADAPEFAEVRARIPAWSLFFADFVAGRRARLGNKVSHVPSDKTTPAPRNGATPRPPTAPLNGGAGGSRPPASKRSQELLQTALQSGGSQASIEALLANMGN